MLRHVTTIRYGKNRPLNFHVSKLKIAEATTSLVLHAFDSFRNENSYFCFCQQPAEAEIAAYKITNLKKSTSVFV